MTRSTFLHGGISFSVAETGEGQPFIFQHGLCGAAGQPADVFPTHVGWRCLTLECRGHGLSEPGDPAEFSIATFAKDVAAYIEKAKLGKVVVGGISMGAAISLYLAVHRPDLVKALVLARPAWVDSPNPENGMPNRIVGELIQKHGQTRAKQIFEELPIASQLRNLAPDNLASLLGFFKRDPSTTTAELLTRIASSNTGVTQKDIGGIKVPTLVIGHARDLIHPLSMARDIANLIPSARLVEITPKADSLDGYRSDFRAALAAFLTENK